MARTVEGDLGIRYNAFSILEMAGERKILENTLKSNPVVDLDMNMESKLRYLSEHIGVVPEKEDEFYLDMGLARTATEIAMERHAGHRGDETRKQKVDRRRIF